MNKFMVLVSSLVEKECRTSMLLNDMDIYGLMLYAQQIEESKLMERSNVGKRPRVDEPGKHKLMKRFYHQDSSMENKDRVSNKNSQ